MMGNMVVRGGVGGSVEAATGWTLTRFMSVLHLFLFPMSLSPSLTACFVVHTWASPKQEIQRNRTQKQADCTSCNPVPKVNNDLRCDFLRGQSRRRHKIRAGLVHEGCFPAVHCPLCASVTFRCTNNVLMMRFSFFQVAPCYQWQVVQLALVCPLWRVKHPIIVQFNPDKKVAEELVMWLIQPVFSSLRSQQARKVTGTDVHYLFHLKPSSEANLWHNVWHMYTAALEMCESYG